jgi:hypothetical protein
MCEYSIAPVIGGFVIFAGEIGILSCSSEEVAIKAVSLAIDLEKRSEELEVLRLRLNSVGRRRK